MAKIYLNESHIRAIVRETLENIMMGEDFPVLPAQKAVNMINASEYSDTEEVSVDREGNGHVQYYFTTQDGGHIILVIYFNVRSHEDEYEPETNYGGFEIDYITVNRVYFNYNDNEYNLDLSDKTALKYFEDMVFADEDVANKAAENIDNFYDDSDERYEAMRDREYGL
jgi:hypothetical protein